MGLAKRTRLVPKPNPLTDKANSMANHRKGITPADCERWRSKIQVAAIINRMQKIAMGEVDATTAQLRAGEILLRKKLPDLSSMELTGDIAGNIVFTWASDKPAKSDG